MSDLRFFFEMIVWGYYRSNIGPASPVQWPTQAARRASFIIYQLKVSMKTHIVLSAFLLLLAPLLNAQYIAEVHQYVPAPGQLINELPWGTPSSAASIVGGTTGTLSLGAFGGYVVFAFDEPIQNHPDHPYGVDFTIFGNPLPEWSEPGIVWVMKDENQNGQPDDTWHELAGSDRWFSSTKQNYQVTYFNPGGNSAVAVPWNDNYGNSGFIPENAYHTQPYYPLQDSFPGIDADSYTLSGTQITGSVDTSAAIVSSKERAFGYADNKLRGIPPYELPDNPYTPETENAGGDAFDLQWAVDTSGNYVELDEAHFVKVQTGMLADGGWLGESSTEIAGAILTEPVPGITGETRMVVIKDLPAMIRENYYQLEAFAFDSGRLQPDESISWETNQPWATVNQNHELLVMQSGTVEITASLTGHPEISTAAEATIELSASVAEHTISSDLQIRPNPASIEIMIPGLENAKIQIMNISGVPIREISGYEGQSIHIGDLQPGFYLVKIKTGSGIHTAKFIRK